MANDEVQKWVDPAMFAAEPQEEAVPRVQLLSCTPDPLGTIASVAHAYQGKFHESLAEITDGDRRFYLSDVRKNVLAAPLEFVHFHFRITGVTRGFTHQMVRQRTACYAQESMRFAVKEDFPVALPPSLAGTESWEAWQMTVANRLWPQGMEPTKGREHEYVAMINKAAQEWASKEQLWRREWDGAVAHAGHAYNNLINSGMPAEDARGLAPTSVLTQLNYTTTLRHLIDHAGLRLCTQAQFEWRLVWVEIIKAIREYGRRQTYAQPDVDKRVVEMGELEPDRIITTTTRSAGWQFEEIANLFKPICYKTGKCEFKSDFDRHCSIRDRVDAFHAAGMPSEFWDVDAVGPHPPFPESERIPGIRDVEWLADPKAARQ